MDFKDKIWIVTGSSQGIGLELGRQLERKGAGVVFNGRRDPGALTHDLQQIKEDSCIYVRADVSSFSDCEKLVGVTIEKFGRIDGLILNAGITAFGEFSELNETVVRQMMEINILGIIWITQLTIPYLKASNGSILFLSSIASIHGIPRYSIYSAVKAAMNAMAQSLRIELKNEGVFVGLALVGFIENEKQKKALSPRGEWESIPSRSRFRPMSREQLAVKLLRQLSKHRSFRVYTLMGKTGYLIYRYSPKTYKFLLERDYRKMK